MSITQPTPARIEDVTAMKVRHDDGSFVIEEHAGHLVGEFRFALDRRERQPEGYDRIRNIGWYRTYRGALNALSMERGGLS
jgi:hypothetical protein